MKKLTFTQEQREKADFILNNPISQFSSLLNNQVKDLAITWCYYSGKIEGNTYSYVETEALLKDNITSPKRYEDAKMLKNLYNTFISCAEQIRKDGHIMIDRFTVNSIHSMLTADLIPDSARGTLRNIPVAITGTSYIPPKEPDEIAIKFNSILEEQYHYNDPLEKAVFIHCNIARLQPFIDGNKRTSRMLESVVLMNGGIIPVRSHKEIDILNYRDSIVHYYETEDYKPYIDYMLNNQIERINELAPAKLQYSQSGISR